MIPGVNFDPIPPAELKTIVDAWGGVEPFARVIHAKPRTVKAWLYDERKLKGPVALLVRQLGFPQRKSQPLQGDQTKLGGVDASPTTQQGG